MRRLLATTAAAAMLALAATAPIAGAAYEPLGTATTTVSLSPAFASFLKANGLRIEAAAPARAKGRRLSLPLAAGKWDPTIGRGEIESEGAIVFKGKRRSLPFKNLTVKANRTPLTAKVGGGQLKVASAKSVAAKREGFGESFSAKALRLSTKVATRLNKKLRPERPFQPNQLIGALRTKSVPETMAVLPRNRLALAFAPQLVAKLNDLFVSLNPISPAELAPGPVLSFPIAAASTISPDGAEGTLRTAGEAELLQLGAGQLFWGEQWLDLSAGVDLIDANLQPSPPFGGKQAQGPLFALSLQGAQIAPNPRARTVAVAGASLTLSQLAADQMNQLLAGGKPVFVAGEALGTVSFTAQGQ
ncbi:MAG TPA: hypothetical protein VFZ25_02075 [Chloroflexota bacterium]|nr:hypothetical protein [Chloroflexota bacterium]